MKKNIFIDGEVGTTGLQVRERLSQHPNVNILPVEQSKRKDPSYKKEMLEAAAELKFERAAKIRDEIKKIENKELGIK